MKTRSYLFRALLIAAAVTGLCKIIFSYRLVQNLEAASYDLRQVYFAPETKVHEDIVMIWLDELTMQALPYRSPIPRDFLAMLTEKLAEAKPRLVAYDIFFKDPSFAEADAVFAESLKKVNGFAVVPLRLEDKTEDEPFPAFYNQLSGLGLADLPFNPFDATVRATQLEYQTITGLYPSFASRLYHAITQQNPTELFAQKFWKRFGPVQLTPFWNDKSIAIRFASPPSQSGSKSNKFKVYSASLVIKGVIPAAWLNDKIVLIGASYADLKDAFLTPYYAAATNYARMNGVEIHANILSSLLTKQFYYFFQNWQTLFATAWFAFFVAWSGLALHPLKSSALLVFLSAVLSFKAIYFFMHDAVVFPMVIILIGGVAAYVCSIGWRAITEGKQRKFIKGVFSQYVPAQVVEQMSSNPKLLKLGGEEKIVTSLFSDLAGFTTLAEKLSPQQLVVFLNEYLSKMNDILFRYGATLDKYEGDAIIAFFNAPLPLAQHELKATQAALEMQVVSRALNVVTRIGLNTGKAVVGNMGSEKRFDYTAIGDTINLASRIEGANKFYGTMLLAAESTVSALRESTVARPVDRVRVKGKTEAILLYEILAERPAYLKTYIEAFACFEQREFMHAAKLITEVLNIAPQDGPSLALQKRIDRAAQDANWNLITSLEGK